MLTTARPNQKLFMAMVRSAPWSCAQQVFQTVDHRLGLAPGTVELRTQSYFQVPIIDLCTKGFALDCDRMYWAPERVRDDWHQGCAAVYRKALTAIGFIVSERVDQKLMTNPEAVAFTQNDVANIFRPFVDAIDAITD